MKKLAHRLAMAVLLIFIMCQNVSAAQMLIPGGQLIGLELSDNSVTVAAFHTQLGLDTKAAGLQIGDKITKINNKKISCAQDIRQALENANGPVELYILRDGKAKTLKITPQNTPEGPRLGVYLKQSVTGVGTVTWYDPESGKFGALGHGVNTVSGSLLQMHKGSAYNAEVLSVKKGLSGQPGQIVGSILGANPIGTLSKNTQQGIFGTIDSIEKSQALPTGTAKAGAATIRSTVKNESVQEYSVEILKIYPNANPSGRNMLLRITDPALLETTGGIVQGMSGSPIIQDGKIIGAVTHVLVNDPTTGYGIFIENMLDAAA